MAVKGKWAPAIPLRDFWEWNSNFPNPPLNFKSRFAIQAYSLPGGNWPGTMFWSVDGERSADGTFDFWRWYAPPGYGDAWCEIRLRPCRTLGVANALVPTFYSICQWNGQWSIEREMNGTGAPGHRFGLAAGVTQIGTSPFADMVFRAQDFWSPLWSDYPLSPPPLGP